MAAGDHLSGGQFNINDESMGDPTKRWRRQGDREHSPYETKLVARDPQLGGKGVGYLTYHQSQVANWDPDHGNRTRFHVGVVEVHPEHRRRGVASALFDQLDEHLRYTPEPDPEQPIDYGSFTPEGAKFHKARTGQAVMPTARTNRPANRNWENL
jgi:GNAT superfamily N-acetyltransferase